MEDWVAAGASGIPTSSIHISYMFRDAEDGNGGSIRLSKHPDWAIAADVFGQNSSYRNVHETGWNVLYADGGVAFYSKDVAKIVDYGSNDAGSKSSWEEFTSAR